MDNPCYKYDSDDEDDVLASQFFVTDKMSRDSDAAPDSDSENDLPYLSDTASSGSRCGSPGGIGESPSAPHPAQRLDESHVKMETEDFTDDDESDLEKLKWCNLPRNPRKINKLKFREPEAGPSHNGHVDISSPKSIFTLYFTEILMTHIVDQSNIYALQNNRNLDLSIDELSAFLGILIIMGFHTLPSIRLYWSQNINFRVERISAIMPSKRFLKILRNIHLNNNFDNRPDGAFDRLFKIRPMLTYLNERFHLLYNPSRWLTIDESIIKFKTRNTMKHYRPMKQLKRGFKVWVLCDSNTGYALNMDIFTGKVDSNRGEGEMFVEEASKPYRNKGFILYFDHFFTSIKLGGRLLKKGLFSCSTIRPNKKGFPSGKLKQDKDMKKGDFDFTRAGDISVLKWRDFGSKPFSVLTTLHNPSQFVKKNRVAPNGKVEEILVPEAVVDYNEHIGGVDQFDHLMATYTISWKSRRWWMKLFYYLLDASVVNSYVLYKTTIKNAQTKRKPMTHLDFRSTLADELIRDFCSTHKTGRGISSSVTRFNNTSEHMPIKLPTQHRCCIRCTTIMNRRRRSQMGCKKCDVALCLECFLPFHTPDRKK